MIGHEIFLSYCEVVYLCFQIRMATVHINIVLCIMYRFCKLVYIVFALYSRFVIFAVFILYACMHSQQPRRVVCDLSFSGHAFTGLDKILALYSGSIVKRKENLKILSHYSFSYYSRPAAFDHKQINCSYTFRSLSSLIMKY